MYRIKTKQEFLDEFGENWRINVTHTFPDNMDHLLGKDIPSHFNDMLNIMLRLKRGNVRYSSYFISYDMIKLSKIVPSYAPKKLEHDK